MLHYWGPYIGYLLAVFCPVGGLDTAYKIENMFAICGLILAFNAWRGRKKGSCGAVSRIVVGEKKLAEEPTRPRTLPGGGSYGRWGKTYPIHNKHRGSLGRIIRV